MLASQLSTDKLADLSIIPPIFLVQLLVSWVAARAMSRVFRFSRRASNFVTAMSVFGNSNSLPPPLVLSLARTLKGIHWDRIPGDNDDEVAARGIFYLVIFQQLGHLLRWSWGYHVLLAPKHKYAEYQEENAGYRDEEEHDTCDADDLIDVNDSETTYEDSPAAADSELPSPNLSEDEPGNKRSFPHSPTNNTELNGHNSNSLHLFPRIANGHHVTATSQNGVRSMLARGNHSIKNGLEASKASITGSFRCLYQTSPAPIQSTLRLVKFIWLTIIHFLWEIMNPPLWAMLAAILVASVPVLQQTLFENEFVRNSLTNAIESTGNVAVPLMLVVLGANLGRKAEVDDEFDPEEERIGTKLLIASLLSRMVIPIVVLAPVLILMVKYIDVVILGDPIFVIVCFLLTGAPTALQLAQICQINGVFEKTMDRILFQSYAVW